MTFVESEETAPQGVSHKGPKVLSFRPFPDSYDLFVHFYQSIHFTHSSIYLSAHPHVHLPTIHPTNQSSIRFTHSSIYLSVHPHVHLPTIHPSNKPSIHFTCLSTHPFIHPSHSPILSNQPVIRPSFYPNLLTEHLIPHNMYNHEPETRCLASRSGHSNKQGKSINNSSTVRSICAEWWAHSSRVTETHSQLIPLEGWESMGTGRLGSEPRQRK